ncbi:hypothetical protein LNKW23_48140 [Paralimibaculum aggregatum]|uniref:Apple domain-containing protein n=1 Tax=Paralimibaculum aggregatum TaxID=3036245 RepID=A0ABQ6LU63_9RHOB|nr:PAN domain-containing protein [Limibaculum sp. NKW23]GMG85591.1 hypothetical protein LNKW23_48140 [Limibaculum sp. NKW23]
MAAQFLAGGSALADPLEEQLRDTIGRLATQMHIRDFGRDTPAQIFIRQPRDNSQGVVCTPLSSFIQRKFRNALIFGLNTNDLDRAAVVPRLSEGGTQLVVNLSWRRRDDPSFDIAISIGQFVDGQDSEFFSSDLTAGVHELSDDERRCLFRLDVNPDWRVAEEPVIVYQSIENFQDMLGMITEGERFRVLGWIEGNEDWALVRMFPKDPQEPGTENLGFALLTEGATRDELVEQLAAVKEDLAVLQARNAGLETEIAALQGRLGTAEDEKAGMRSAVAEARAQMDRERRRAGNLEERIGELNGEIGDLNRQIAALDATIRQLESEGSGRAEELETALENARRDTRLLRDQLDEALGKLNENRSEMNRLRGELAQERYSKTQLQGRLAGVNADLVETRGERDRLTEELRILKGSLPVQGSQDSGAEIERLERQIRDYNTRIESYREQARRYNSEISALNSRIRTHERDIATLRQSLDARVREVERLTAENRRLDTELARLRRQSPAAPEPGPVVIPVDRDRIRVMEQVDLDNSGAKYLDRRMIRQVSHEDCKNICRRDSGCKYYTYNTQHNICFTKSGFAKRSTYKYAVSGEMTDRIGR